MDKILFLLLLCYFIWLAVSVTSLGKRVRELEERLKGKERCNHQAPSPEMRHPVVEGPAETVLSPAKAGGMASATGEFLEKMVGEVPPPLPIPSVEKPGVGSPSVQGPVQAAGGEPEPAAPNPLFEWLEKVGLKPPHAGEEGSNLIAWWSTRIGLVLGVIAAVFFGLYVNQNTVPLVRLLELCGVAGGLFVGGRWLEKTLGTYGRALSAGGLALLYVGAYASYGLPAMKVIESPLMGAVVQVAAVVLMAGWALWRRNEGVFGLALALGYVTSWFSCQEGVEPLPLVSLMVLAAGGSALFALRGWWSGMWTGLVGSSIGLILLATYRWLGGGGPADVVGLGAACGLTAIWVAGLFARARKGDLRVNSVLPLATSAGVAVGAVVSWALGVEWEWYYATYALLLFGVGWLWRRFGEGAWEVMWAKASVFVALFLIARFEGPARAYGLLAQGASLAFLARRKDWVVFDLGALLAMVTGWVFAQRELADGVVSTWGASEFVVLGYLFGVLGVLAYFGKGKKFERERRQVVSVVVGLLAIGVVWVGCWRIDHDWALLAALVAGGVFLLVGRLAKFRKFELIGVLFLLPTLIWVMNRGVGVDWRGVTVDGVLWQSVVWIGVSLVYCWWLGEGSALSHRASSGVVMLGSIVAIIMVGVEVLGWEWIAVVLLGVAAVWQLADRRIPIPGLMWQSVLAAVPAGVIVLGDWDGEMESAILLALIVLALVYWAGGVFLRRAGTDERDDRRCEFVRGLVLAVVLLTGMSVRLEGVMLVLGTMVLATLMILGWRGLQDRSLLWIGSLTALLALGYFFLENRLAAWREVLVAGMFAMFVFNGLFIARSGRREQLANPRVASLFWGSLAIFIVLTGLTRDGRVEGWTTAFWALGAMALLTAGFWGGLRGYRIIGLLGIGVAILRLFSVDLQETFWRIVAFGVTGALLVGIGYIYNRFHRRLAAHDLDWRHAAGRKDL